MIQLLRYLAIRLWLLLIWGLPAGLWLLPRAVVWVPGLSPVMAMSAFLAAGGILQGLILDLAGRQRILGLIREGELWEQAGVRPRAEELFVKAVRIFDSALISTWAGRRLSPDLTRAMAGFYLTGPTRYPGFRPAAARYLLYSPEDETLALLWLDRYLLDFRESTGDSLTRAVLTALAQAHHGHPKIARKLAGPFLEQGRRDLPAKRLYRSVLKMMETGRAELSQERKEQIEALLAEETLAGPGRKSEAESGLQEPEVTLSDPDGPTLGDRLGSREFSETVLPSLQSAGRQTGRAAARILGRSVGMAGTAALGLGRGMTWGVSRAGTGAGTLTRAIGGVIGREAGKTGAVKKGTVKKGVKIVLISALALWLGIFLWSSLTHMLKSTSTEPVAHQADGTVSRRVSGPFTIQVAAYLKEIHADRYVQVLREKGVTAHVKKTLGGGKTWFLVRVSTFGTKEAAAAFGKKLKAQGKIDDFFVSNT